MADEETAVATVDAPEAKYKMSLTVDIQDVGPCRKHVRVKVAREDIDHFRKEAAAEVSETAAVPGFRVGHVPASLIERRFMAPFLDKSPMAPLLRSVPVHVILNDQAALVGAAVAALDLLSAD